MNCVYYYGSVCYNDFIAYVNADTFTNVFEFSFPISVYLLRDRSLYSVQCTLKLTTSISISWRNTPMLATILMECPSAVVS